MKCIHSRGVPGVSTGRVPEFKWERSKEMPSNIFQWKYPMKINSYVKPYLNLFECLNVHRKIFGAGKIARLSATQFLNKSQFS